MPTIYERSLSNGTRGSKHDPFWSRVKKMHECCQSRVWWKHKINCVQVIGEDKQIGNDKWKALDIMTDLDKKQYIKQLFNAN